MNSMDLLSLLAPCFINFQRTAASRHPVLTWLRFHLNFRQNPNPVSNYWDNYAISNCCRDNDAQL